MDVSKSIRVGLAKKGKRQKWLAKQMGVSEAYISAVCKGDKNVGSLSLPDFAEVFEVPVSEFIKWGE